MRSLLKPSLCFVLAVLLPINPNLVQNWVASAQAQEEAKQAKKELTAEDLKKMADEMERAFKALEAAEKEIPRDTFDPKAIVEKVGKEPDKLFEWVRDKTYWVPYQGCLRGHIGVLMDRLGSSLDRALLLAELLRVAGHKVRLAHASLTETQAKELLPKLRPVPKEPLPASPQTSKKDLDQLIEKYAREYQLDAAEMRKNIDKASLQAGKLAEDVVQRVADQVPRILKAVGPPAEKDVQAQREKEAAAELAALRDHWWVQRQDGDAWLDLDPLLPDAESGKATAKAKETIAPNKDGKLVLPSKYCHEVIVRIVIEQWKNEKVTEKTALNHTLRPSELFGQRIALNHYPMKWPKDLDLFKEKKPLEKLKATVLAQDEWLPILTVGSEQFIQSSFTDTGDTVNNPLAPLLGGGAQKLGGNIGGILGSGKIGQAPGRKPATQSHLTAEWIEYQVRVAGNEPRIIRRQIFDLLGPAARMAKNIGHPKIENEAKMERSLATLGRLDILPLASRLSDDFVAHHFAESLISNRSTLIALNSGKKWDHQALRNELKKIKPMSNQLFQLSLMRHRCSPFPNSFFLRQPNILTFSIHLVWRPNQELRVCREFDIVENDMDARATSKMDRFEAYLHQGVLETNAEAFLIPDCGKTANTAEIFAASKTQNIKWLVIRNIKDLSNEKLELSPDIRARILQELEKRNVLLIPEKKILIEDRFVFAWWRVNPLSGHTLGIGEKGTGGAAEEKMLESFILVSITFTVACLVGLNPPPGQDDWTTARQILGCYLFGALAGLGQYSVLSEGQLISRLLANGIGGYIVGRRSN